MKRLAPHLFWWRAYADRKLAVPVHPYIYILVSRKPKCSRHCRWAVADAATIFIWNHVVGLCSVIKSAHWVSLFNALCNKPRAIESSYRMHPNRVHFLAENLNLRFSRQRGMNRKRENERRKKSDKTKTHFISEQNSSDLSERLNAEKNTPQLRKKTFQEEKKSNRKKEKRKKIAHT